MALGHRIMVLRSLMAVLAPLTGTRATGTATVAATGADVVLPKGCFAAPIVASGTGNAAIARDKLVFTTAETTVTSAGVSVPVTSLLGGTRHNFADGTQLRWDPSLTGVELVSSLDGAMSGGLNPTGDAALQRIVTYEELSMESAAALFAAKLHGHAPAAVVTWSGSGRAQRRGRDVWQRSDQWVIYVVVTRKDGTVERGHEGLNLLDIIEAYLGERGAVDGRHYSDRPTAILGARRHRVTPSSFIYALTLETSGAVQRIDTRVADGASAVGTIAAWDRTRYDVEIAETPAYPLVTEADYAQP